MNISQPAKNGFTLVELAIVMIIIGLLIGGILKGQELVHQASVNSTIRQITAYKAAYLTFRDKYGGPPGDIVRATSIWPDTANGNGDGLIYGYAETYRAWQQLALSDLITGSFNGVGVTGAIGGIGNAGVNIPGAAITPNGFMLWNSRETFQPAAILDDGRDRLWLGGSSNTNSGSWEGTVLGADAQMIDSKIDDGDPNTGGVMAETGYSKCLNGAYPTAQYNVLQQTATKGCMLSIRIY